MRKLVLFIIALLLLFSQLGLCEDFDAIVKSASDYLLETKPMLKLITDDGKIIRSAYMITLPDDRDALNEIIVEQYGKFKYVILIEFGYSDIGPIVQSYYECVGIYEDGTMESCYTPQKIRSRTFSLTDFENISITPIYDSCGLVIPS